MVFGVLLFEVSIFTVVQTVLVYLYCLAENSLELSTSSSYFSVVRVFYFFFLCSHCEITSQAHQLYPIFNTWDTRKNRNRMKHIHDNAFTWLNDNGDDNGE